MAVRAWRGWRRRTALTAAADAMRLRSLVRFTRPRFTAWRIVSLAKCRGRILAEMRVDGCRRHAMWRAWRAWYLGPALAGFTAGAPTPSPPEDSAVIDDTAVIASTDRRTERGGHDSNVEEAADYFGGDRPAASPAPPVQLPIRAATRRDAVASTDAYRAVKLGAAFRVWRSSRGARIVSRLARHHEAEEEERGGGEARRRIGRGCRRVTSRRIRRGYASAVRARLEGAAPWTHATPVCPSSTRARGIFVNLVEKKSPSANRNDLVQKKSPTPGPRRRGISATLPTR